MELPPLPPSVALPYPSLATHSTPPRHHGWTVAALATAWKLAPMVCTRRATRRWAVVEDEHCQAVGAWLRNFVIAKDFCPWAKPAKTLGSAEGSNSLTFAADVIFETDVIFGGMEEQTCLQCQRSFLYIYIYFYIYIHYNHICIYIKDSLFL